MGFYGSSRTPFIIGSHTSYRTSAVLEIGGFQPTRAEDHLDTVVLAAHGYRGVFVPDTIATGDGPEDFRTYLRQQFAWAHSMITVLFSWTPRLLRRYTPAQGFQFLFSQTWYLLWSASMLTLWAAPLVALVSGRRIAATSRQVPSLLHPACAGGWLIWCFATVVPPPRAADLLARSGADGGAVADRPVGARQRSTADRAPVHDHAERRFSRLASFGARARAAARLRNGGARWHMAVGCPLDHGSRWRLCVARAGQRAGCGRGGGHRPATRASSASGRRIAGGADAGPIGALAWLGALVVALGTTAVLYWDSVLAGVS